MKFILTTYLAAFVACSSRTITRDTRYDGQKVISVGTSRKLMGFADKNNFDVWGHNNGRVELRLSDKQIAKLKAAFPGVQYRVLNNDVQKSIDQETIMLNKSIKKRFKLADWFTAYHQFDDIANWMKDVADKYPKLTKFNPSIGKSVEGRNIPLIKITGEAGDYASKKRIWFQALQHAREWISTTTLQYVAYDLLDSYGKNAKVTELMDKVEFVIVPVANPDGYAYSWATDRLWRKTRAVINGKKYGVDPNRNWPDHWNRGGSSSSPSSETYMGPSPGSEPEVKALMAEYLATPNVIGAIDFHSFSQLVLYPFGWTDDKSPDEPILTKLGDKMVASIKSVAGTRYVKEQSSELYIASGGADDWFNGDATQPGKNRAYALTLELSPADAFGNSGFILKPDRIVPVGKDIVPSVITFVDWCLQNPLPVGKPHE